MTNQPNPGSESLPTHRPWRRRLRRYGLPVGSFLLVGTGGVLWWSWQFVHNDLAPLVSSSLSTLLNRPVKVGALESVTLTSMRFGRSELPITATENDHAEVEAVEVTFNPIQPLLTRRITLNINLVNPTAYLQQDQDGTWIIFNTKQTEEEGPIQIEPRIHVQDAQATLVPKVVLPLAKNQSPPPPIRMARLDGDINLLEKNQRITYEVTAQTATKGDIQLRGETQVPTQETKLQVQAQNMAIAEVGRLINLPFALTGRGNGDLAVQFRPNQTMPYVVGTAQFKDASLSIPQLPTAFTKASGQLRMKGDEIKLEGVKTHYGKIPIQAQGVMDLKQGFNLDAKVPPIALPPLLETLQLKLPFQAEGEITAAVKLTGQMEEPILTGTARNTKAGRLDQVALRQYGADFRLTTADQLLVISDIQATPTAGGTVSGAGRIHLNDPIAKQPTLALAFQVTDVPGDPIAQVYSGSPALPFTIGRVNAQASITGTASDIVTRVRWQAPEGTYPGSGDVLIADGLTTLRNTQFRVNGGNATVDAQSDGKTWEAIVHGNAIALQPFSPDLRGQLNGKFFLSGLISSFKPANIRARGQAVLSQGIAVINEVLTADVRWDGNQVVLERATAPGFRASGTIAALLEGKNAPAITGLNLEVDLNDYSLAALGLPTLPGVTYGGQVDFRGRIGGTPEVPQLAGQVALRQGQVTGSTAGIPYQAAADFTGQLSGTATNPILNGKVDLNQLVVNGQAFEPMQGTVSLNQGTKLNLAGDRDRIFVRLDARYQPLEFDIQRNQAIARGRVQGGLLLTELQNFPLALLSPAQLTALSLPLSGTLKGNLAVNLAKMQANGKVEIEDPAIGLYKAQRFDGRMSFADGVATLANAQLRRGDSLFVINGSANIKNPLDPQIKGNLTVAQGTVQDVLSMLQVFDLADFATLAKTPLNRQYGSKADLVTVPIDQSQMPLLDRLHRLAEINQLMQQSKTQTDNQFPPPLESFRGSFGGELQFSGSPRSGFTGKFNLNGQNWEWGKLAAKSVQIVGSLENNTISLLPLRLQTDNSVVAFSGQISPQSQSGQLRIENYPIEDLIQSFNLPLDLEGQLNAVATLSGTLQNPQAVGFLSLANGVINNTPVQEARGGFNYADARLSFGGTMLITGTDPLDVSGSFPYPLPFANTQPESQAINLAMNVSNEGLSLLNVLTNNQLSWINEFNGVKGSGDVKLNVAGTLKDPIATGTISLNNAIFRSNSFPEPVTNVTGEIKLDQDRIRIPGIIGQFSRGKLAIVGILPIRDPLASSDPDADNPLRVTLEKLKLSLKGLYQGGTDGTITVTGSAFNPKIGGAITLSEGQVLLADSPQTPATTKPPLPLQNSQFLAEFDDLKLKLGQNLRVTRAPIINFLATGELSINGTLDEIQPEGIIRLTAGQVNLFTTQFTLARGYPQTAEFVASQGLDPDLDVRLIASVPETTGYRMPESARPSEIADQPSYSSFGGLQTVRIQARVQGPSSQLTNNLELTSSPARSQAEIVSLLGGGFVETLGRGDSALGIANLAGSALLTNVQSFIGNALGLSEFRLFPTQVRSDRKRDSRGSSTLGLAAEAAIDITPAVSFSILRILTSNQPTQFGLRYRVNRNILLRGSTDFSGDNRAVIEYETRF